MSKENEDDLRLLCHTAKNLYNEALYAVRQHFFATGKYLNYNDVYKDLKESENYRLLNSNMAQQILKEVDGSFHSFFSLLKMKNEGRYDAKVCIPRYLDKDGCTTLVIGFVRLNGNKLLIPYSNSFRKNHKNIEFSVPPQLIGKQVKEIRIIPKQNGRFFEVQYTYKAEDIAALNKPKSARYIIDYCTENHIGNIILGYNNDFQKNSDMGKANNQNFVNIPFGKLKWKLTYLCDMYWIKLILQEESYTSKASFFDNDDIPVYSKGDNKKYTFSGERIERGMYETSLGKKLNADVNGALNILKKSSAVDLTVLSSRGEVDTPLWNKAGLRIFP